MKIILDENYYLENFSYGFALYDRRLATTKISKKGTTSIDKDAIAYVATVPQGIAAYMRVSLNETLGDVSIQEYIAAYKAQVDRITGLLPKVGD